MTARSTALVGSAALVITGAGVLLAPALLTLPVALAARARRSADPDANHSAGADRDAVALP